MFSFDEVKNADAEIYAAMADEMGRQRSHLELIASENLVSKGVMAAMGSHLTNKYAEGYPGKRYYVPKAIRRPNSSNVRIFCVRKPCSRASCSRLLVISRAS